MSDLITRLSKLDAPDNCIDVLVEVALFKPDKRYASARANKAGTKVIFTTTKGDAKRTGLTITRSRQSDGPSTSPSCAQRRPAGHEQR